MLSNHNPSELSFSDSLKGEQRKRFYERHISIAMVMILVVFFAPFVGVWVNGLAGAIAGMVLSAIAYYLTPYIVLRMGG